jgi:hypothetical protein
MHNTREKLIVGFCPSLGDPEDTVFLKLDLFPSSGERVGSIYSIGPVRKS